MVSLPLPPLWRFLLRLCPKRYVIYSNINLKQCQALFEIDVTIHFKAFAPNDGCIVTYIRHYVKHLFSA